ALSNSGLPVEAKLALAPRVLPVEKIVDLMHEAEDCGPLTLTNPPANGWALDDSIVITGQLAEQGARQRLLESVKDVAGDREVLVDAEILNANLCKIEQALPRAASLGFAVNFGFGDRADPNPAGRYFVGENPVIDVVIPADVTDGYLWVFIVDVTGSVFHLLPNLNRPDNSVADLRKGKTGAVPVRVAYGMGEAKGNSKMAFVVDDSVLGKSKIVVLHAAAPVFESLRPISESTSSFAGALTREETGADLVDTFSIDSRVLTTEAK
ncbi:MAG: DUF4384 domain-containing protein, partial [Pseudorhodobacter sp.]|nr:DUF4384 domain-containing protein [Pseudorhodobacter sp.]